MIPEILSSYSLFSQWIEGNLSELKGHDKGDPWQEFTKKLIPLTDLGKKFHKFKDNPRKTRDNGWDVKAIHIDEEKTDTLYIQAKFKLVSQNDLDSVISSFVPLAGVDANQLMFSGMSVDRYDVSFAICTLSDIQSAIIPNFERSGKPTVSYFKQWISEGRLTIVDGPTIWKMYREYYLKAFAEPQEQILSFACPPTHFANVYLGILAASELRRIYNNTGDSIFFENVRDFTGQTDVNEKIADTIRYEPDQFLTLNNGVVFGASNVTELGPTKLRLERASIVNGCQTTTTIAQSIPTNGEDFYLQVKVVVASGETSWKVTHAANYQNEINRIDLDLAKHIRPQLVKKQSWWAGYPVTSDNDPWSIIDVFNKQKVTWKNIRIIFIGLFSRDPGNMFDVNFSAVQGELLSSFLQDEDLKRKLFDVVFALHEASERGARQAAEWLNDDQEMGEIFSRLLGDTRAPYMQFLTILAICALADLNIATREDSPSKEYDRMKLIINHFHQILDAEPEELTYAYFIAFEKVAGDVLVTVDSGERDAISKKMHSRITKRDKFTNLFLQVKLGIQTARRGRERYS
jgi:hypothetical protein